MIMNALNGALDHHPARIKKVDKDFVKELDFKDIKFLVKIRGIQKIEKMNFVNISVSGNESKKVSNL